jgi:hypothetical protein
MPRVLWPLLHHRPIVEVVLTLTSGGQLLVRQLIADTGAATALAGFELVLRENDCLACGGIPSHPVTLGGAYIGTFPVYVGPAPDPAPKFRPPSPRRRRAGVPCRIRRDRRLPLSQPFHLRELRRPQPVWAGDLSGSEDRITRPISCSPKRNEALKKEGPAATRLQSADDCRAREYFQNEILVIFLSVRSIYTCDPDSRA